MDISNVVAVIGGLIYISYTIYLANQEKISGERGSLLRWLLYGIAAAIFLYGVLILSVSFLPPVSDAQIPHIDPLAGAVNFALTALLSLFSWAIVSSAEVRARIRRFLPASATYDPESPVHTTAWVLTLAMIAITIGDFVLNGGIAGMAQSLQTNSVGIGDIVYEDALWVFAATLGIGLFLRRTPRQALERLGLRIPTSQDMNWGMVVGLVMIGLVIIFSLIWSNLVSAQEMQQQTAASNQLAASINSLPLALVISAVVAIGEEVFFRGALQPVFGIWLTSLFFSVLHTQYTLTPATLLIFVTSMALGWLRQRYSTTASIIGHFFYNFIQLALAILGTSV